MTRPAHEWPPEIAHLPVCPKRKLPIPFINEIRPDGTGAFAILDEAKARLCLAGRLCAMCGLPMGWWVAFLGDQASLKPGGAFIEPPVHERCAEIAAVAGYPDGRGACPFITGEGVPRRPLEDDVAVLSTPEDLAGVARTAAKRPWYLAVVHDYSAAWAPGHHGALVRVYRAGRPRRVRRFDYAGGRLAEVTEPAPAVRAVRAQRRTRKGRPG